MLLIAAGSLLSKGFHVAFLQRINNNQVYSWLTHRHFWLRSNSPAMFEIKFQTRNVEHSNTGYAYHPFTFAKIHQLYQKACINFLKNTLTCSVSAVSHSESALTHFVNALSHSERVLSHSVILLSSFVRAVASFESGLTLSVSALSEERVRLSASFLSFS